MDDTTSNNVADLVLYLYGLWLVLVLRLICSVNMRPSTKIGTSNGKATNYYRFTDQLLIFYYANVDWLIAQQWRILFPLLSCLRKTALRFSLYQPFLVRLSPFTTLDIVTALGCR